MLRYLHSFSFLLIISTISVCEPTSGQYDLEKSDMLANIKIARPDDEQVSKPHKKLVALVPVRYLNA
jgi:hypothetical protein